jgi:transcriptional regulator with XRE-family HTH domain
MDIEVRTGQLIKSRRDELGLTLQEVADYIGKQQTTVLRYESGEIKTIKAETIRKLAEVLKCKPSYLMGWEDTEVVSIKELPDALIGVTKEAYEAGLSADDIKEVLEIAKRFRKK